MLPMEPEICICPPKNWPSGPVFGHGLGRHLGELHLTPPGDESEHIGSVVVQNPGRGDRRCQESGLVESDNVSADVQGNEPSSDHVDQDLEDKLLGSERSVQTGGWAYLILDRMDPNCQLGVEVQDLPLTGGTDYLNMTVSLLVEDDAYLSPSADQKLSRAGEQDCSHLDQVTLLTEESQLSNVCPSSPNQILDTFSEDQHVSRDRGCHSPGPDTDYYTRDLDLLQDGGDCNLGQDRVTCNKDQHLSWNGYSCDPDQNYDGGHCSLELKHSVTQDHQMTPPLGLTHQLDQDAALYLDGSMGLPSSVDSSSQDGHDVTPGLAEYPPHDCTVDLLGNYSVGLIPCPSLDDSLDSTGGEVDVSRLRAVFDALDRDGDGFVQIEEFVQFATVYGAEQVKDFTKYLDPSGLGVISFEDFYRGITAISSGDPDSQLYDMGYGHEEDSPVCIDDFDEFVIFEPNEVTDSAYMGSESAYSECETFTDEDTNTLVHHEMPFEVETDSAIDATLRSEITDANDSLVHSSGKAQQHNQNLSSDFHDHSIVTVVSGEEHFEDYGEGNEVEFLSINLCQNGETSINGTLDESFLLSSSTDPLAAKLRSILIDEALEFYCSQCHKQINRLEDLSARLSDLEIYSPNKRLSSKKMARHLHQSLMADSTDDLPRDIMDQEDTDLIDKVIYLEKRVTELEKESAANGEQHSRLKHENLQLVHRANALEEQLRDQESKAEETLQEELRRQKEILMKVERERSIEVENLQARLQQLDEENSELRSCVPCLKANIERLEEEKRKLQDEIEDVTYQLNKEQESKRKLADKLAQERHQFRSNKEATQELIEDLRKQLEHLQLFKLEAERRGRSNSSGLQEYNTRTREAELELEIRRIKQDNQALKEQNDELNGQIINLSIQGAKNLFSPSFSESLAAEISSVSRDELMEAIQKQEDINYRLQDYIDRIIVAIMESNPSILEVK